MTTPTPGLSSIMLAEKLGCSTKTLALWCAEHGLPYSRPRGRQGCTWFDLQQVATWARLNRPLLTGRISASGLLWLTRRWDEQRKRNGRQATA